jgi:hypothetical protein
MNELELLRQKLRTRMNEMADALATGAAQDYPAYMKMVGIVEGLAFAERDILDLIEKIQDED